MVSEKMTFVCSVHGITTRVLNGGANQGVQAGARHTACVMMSACCALVLAGRGVCSWPACMRCVRACVLLCSGTVKFRRGRELELCCQFLHALLMTIGDSDSAWIVLFRTEILSWLNK